MECEKCGYKSGQLKKKFDAFLCDICYLFSPNEKKSFEIYVHEKIDYTVLKTFRKNFSSTISNTKKQKAGMIKKAEKGRIVSRAPFGYKIQEGKLIPSEKAREIVEIFEEFLKNELNLSELSKKHNLSINGLKKILRNFTYLGKIKFNNQIYEGNHEKLISPILFNKVQDKLERLKIK